MTTTPFDLNQLESQLSNAKTQLSKLQQESSKKSLHFSNDGNDSSRPHDADISQVVDDDDDDDDNGKLPARLYRRAKDAHARIKFLELSREVFHLFHYRNRTIVESEAGNRAKDANDLSSRTEFCTSLGCLLLRHPPTAANSSVNDSAAARGGDATPYEKKWNELYHHMLQLFFSSHSSAREDAILTFRNHLRNHIPEYPSTEQSCVVVGEALSACAATCQDILKDTLKDETKDTFQDQDTFQDIFQNTLKDVLKDDWKEEWYEFAKAAKCLVELQVVYDALELQNQWIASQVRQTHAMKRHSQNEDGEEQGHEATLVTTVESKKDDSKITNCSWDLDIVDELCRPLAVRLKFHFLGKTTGLIGAVESVAASSGPAEPGSPPPLPMQKKSPLDRFPEWLFRYLRDTVEKNGTLDRVILEGVQPLLEAVVESLSTLSSSRPERGKDVPFQNDEDEDDEEDEAEENIATPTTCIQHLADHRYSWTNIYYLREVARMARHALRFKSFFDHPDVVGSQCTDRTIALRGLQQLFLFDAFVDDKVGWTCRQRQTMQENVDGRMILPPRLTDVFLSSNELILDWFMEFESRRALEALRDCASVTLLSYEQNANSTLDKNGASGQGTWDDAPEVPAIHKTHPVPKKLYPPVTELFLALLHSARCKSTTFSEIHSQQSYISNVICPLSSEFSEMIHGEAASLRKRLLARPSTSSSVMSGLRSSCNLPSDNNLEEVIMEWTGVVTAAHLASQMLLRSRTWVDTIPKNMSSDSPPTELLSLPSLPSRLIKPGSPYDALDEVGRSMERLRDAIVEDFLSAFVETILLERAKLASYIMRCPFVLSVKQDPLLHGGSTQNGTDEEDYPVSLSPDLYDSFHVLSIATRTCRAALQTVEEVFQSGEDGKTNDEEVRRPPPLLFENERGSNGFPTLKSMLCHGARTIFEALSNALSEKFMEIAIDPQGMTPEIHRSGARQFHHDVVTFACLFQLSSKHRAEEINFTVVSGAMQRALDASRLMSLESSRLNNLREVLQGLVVPSVPVGGGISSFFGGGSSGDIMATNEKEQIDDVESGFDRLNVENFYSDERLMEEAQSMLHAKGFGTLRLEEAASIINRRRS